MHFFLLSRHLSCDLSVYLGIQEPDSSQNGAAENFLVNKKKLLGSFLGFSPLEGAGTDSSLRRNSVGGGKDTWTPGNPSASSLVPVRAALADTIEHLPCWWPWEGQQGFHVRLNTIDGLLTVFRHWTVGHGSPDFTVRQLTAKNSCGMGEGAGGDRPLIFLSFFLPPELVWEQSGHFILEHYYALVLLF